MNSQAIALNAIIQKHNPVIFDLLSTKGKSIYFPSQGILAQAAQAAKATLNATIGIALEDNKEPMRLSLATSLPAQNVYPYAPAAGIPSLRKKWQEEMKQKNPSLPTTITMPIATAGITHALSIAGYLFCDAHETIIIPSPYWENYSLIFGEVYNTKIDFFNLFEEKIFNTIHLQQKLHTKSKQTILFNFPHNPTGYSPGKAEAEEIIAILTKAAEKGSKIVVLCDDAYFGLYYTQDAHPESLFARLSSLHQNILTVKIDGASKEQYAWGLRVGFITIGSKGLHPETAQALEEKIAGVIRATVSNTSNLSQNLILQAMNSPTYEKEKARNYHLLKQRFETMNTILQDQKYQHYFRPLPFNSGYFCCLQLRPGLDAEKIRKTLLEKYGNGIIASDNLLRIAFSSVQEKELKMLVENVWKACKEMK